MLRTAMVFFIGLFLIGCENIPTLNEAEEDVTTRLILVDDVSVEQTLEILSYAPAKIAEVRLRYPDHETIWGFDPANPDAIDDFYSEEEKQLSFLLSNFDPNDPLEAEVYDQLFSDLENLGNPGVPMVRWIEVSGRLEIDSPLLSEVQYVEVPHDILEQRDIGRSHEAITDWTRDAYYVPVGGTSKISASGTFQKILLDDKARAALSGTRDGLEIDTLIKGKSNATCAMFGVSSNLPNFYRDTEIFDTSDYRNCAVGTGFARKLTTWTWYWTWHPFSYFNTKQNPLIRVQYQPSRWCWWEPTLDIACIADGALCTCSRTDMPIEDLIMYNYNEAPGRELYWWRN